MVSISEQTEVSISELGYPKGSQGSIGSDEIAFNLKDWNLKQNYTIRTENRNAYTFDFALVSTNNENDVIPINILTGNKTERMDQIVVLYLRAKNLHLQKRYAITPINVTPYENFLSGIFTVPVVKSIVLKNGQGFIRVTSEGVSETESTGSVNSSKPVKNVETSQEPLVSVEEKRDNNARRRRDHTRIIHDILTLAKGSGEIGITKIIYKCNLNYRSALRAVNELLDSKLLEIGNSSGAKQKYLITSEGLNLLDDLKKFNFING